MNAHDESVTVWIETLKTGDAEQAELAFTKIYNQFQEKLLNQAQRQQRKFPPAIKSDEELVQSVFHTFFQRVRKGQFEELTTTTDLHSLFLRILKNKAIKASRYATQQKRDVRKTKSEAAYSTPENSPLNAVTDEGKSPEFDLLFEETLQEIAGDDPDSLEVARLKLEGYTVDEIADKLGKKKRAIEMLWTMIRKRGAKYLDQEDAEV